MPTVRSLEESAVVIAGGSSGVGLASALAFVDAGVQKIALLSRSEERGIAARDLVRARNTAATVEFIAVDADDVSQVLAAIEAANGRHHWLPIWTDH